MPARMLPLIVIVALTVVAGSLLYTVRLQPGQVLADRKAANQTIHNTPTPSPVAQKTL